MNKPKKPEVWTIEYEGKEIDPGFLTYEKLVEFMKVVDAKIIESIPLEDWLNMRKKK